MLLNNADEHVLRRRQLQQGGTTAVENPITALGRGAGRRRVVRLAGRSGPGLRRFTRLGNFTFKSSDKFGKDTNFRGLTVYNNVVYYTKGSGCNGTNSVYFIDTTGKACSTPNGVGLPQPGATLPTLTRRSRRTRCAS